MTLLGRSQNSPLMALLGRSRIRLGLVAAADAVGLYLPALVLGLLAIGALRQADLVGDVGTAIAAIGLVGLGGLFSWVRTRHAARWLAVAQRLDAHLETGDQLASALDFAARHHRSSLADAHIARCHAAAAGPLRDGVVPWAFPRHARVAALVAYAIFAALGPHFLHWQGAGTPIAPARARAVAEGTALAEVMIPELELAATEAGLHVLASRLTNLRAMVHKDLDRLELDAGDPPESLPAADGAASRPAPDEPLPDLPGTKGPAAPAAAGAEGSTSGGLPHDYAPIGKFDDGPIDSVDRAAFAELDELLEKKGMSSVELVELADKVEATSKSIHNFGADAAYHADAGGTPEGGGGAGSDMSGRPPKSMDGALAAVMAKSFGEFLRKYSHKLKFEARRSALERAEAAAASESKMHRSDVDLPAGRAKLRKPDDRAPGAGRDDSDSDPPPMASKLVASLLKDGKTTDKRKGPVLLGDRTAFGGSGAGSGASEEEKAVAPSEETPGDGGEEGELSPVAGRVGAGASDVTFLRDSTRRATPAGRTTTYRDIFAGAIRTASSALERGAVPPDMQEYVRRYFEAIRPR